MTEKIYPKGLMVFAPRDGSPDFVKGKAIITLNEFVAWAKTQTEHMTEYQGNKQLKFDIKEGTKGLYLELDTWKPDMQAASMANTNSRALPIEPKKAASIGEEDDLPF